MRSACRLVLTMLACLALAGCGEQANTVYRWDMSLPWSAQEYHTANAQAFAEAVADRTGGRVQITVHPGAVLGIKGPEALRALSDGVVHMAEMPGVQQIGSIPLLGLESLPFLARNQEELRRLDRLMRPAVAAALQERGAKLLYRVPWPNQNLFFKRAVEDLDAMQGLRIRTYDRLTGDLMTRLGLNPVQVPLADVVPALASGLVDATMTSTTSAAAQRYWEFMSHVFRSNHTWLINLMAVNRKAWDRLPPDLQATVADIAREMEGAFWAVAAKDDQAKLDRLRAHGMGVIEPSAAVLNAMEAAARPMWTAYAESAGEPAGRLLDRFVERR